MIQAKSSVILLDLNMMSLRASQSVVNFLTLRGRVGSRMALRPTQGSALGWYVTAPPGLETEALEHPLQAQGPALAFGCHV